MRQGLLVSAVISALMLGTFTDAVLAVPPPTSISSIAPSQGTIGSQITITGSGFTPILKKTKAFLTKAGSQKVGLKVLSVTSTQITALLKGKVSAGDYQLSVKFKKPKRTVVAATPFTVKGPLFTALNPDTGTVGQTSTLSAGFLGLTPGTVRVGAKKATLVSWQGTTGATLGTVVFKVPAGLLNGLNPVTVTNKVGSTTTADALTVVGQADNDTRELRVSNAAATSNTTVLVQFTKPVNPLTAELANHYRITASQVGGATAANVQVLSATLVMPGMTTVRLITRPQSEIPYILKVTDITDLAGRPIAAPSGPVPSDPSAANFTGIGPSTNGQTDTDHDGITDADEQRGYNIDIIATDGSVTHRAVTSDPTKPDTDNDKVTDDQEKHAGIDPRSPDTDGDTLTDDLEWNFLLSNPADQDTDNDGIQDGYEYCCLGTSPLLDDTDGDQISDGDEVFTRNRNPLVADLPAESISVGDVRLQLDQRFTYVDETGHTVSTTDSAQSTLETDTSLTHTNGESLTLGGSLWLEAGLRDGVAGFDGFFRAHGEFNVSHTSEWSNESVRATQQAYQQSLERGSELSTTSTVTREIVGASISADVTVANKGNVAFSLGEVQVTVSERSPESPTQLIPVATLIPNSVLTTGNDLVFHLGPFNATRGPVVFSSTDVFPNLVEKLMTDPSSLVFSIANFDMTDELGRHFTYSEQIARDRTGGILIDAGDGNVKRNLVATSLQADPDHIGGGDLVGGFNLNGSPIGIPLDFALQHVLGMTKNATTPDGIVSTDQTVSSRARGDDVQLIPMGTTGVPVDSVIIGPGANHSLETPADGQDAAVVTTGYGTQVINGVETLVRVGSQSNGNFGRQWFVGTTDETPAGADFGDLILMPGQDFYLVFVQDLDHDGLFARTEALAGSTDSLADDFDNSKFGQIDPVRGPSDPYALLAPVATPDGIADSKDTDRDGLGDFAEMRVGWQVSADGAAFKQVYSNPRLPDSDGDGLLDPQEQDLRSFCAPNDPRKDALCTFQAGAVVTQHDAISIIAGPDGKANTHATGDDVQLIPFGTTGLTYATRIVAPGANGTIDTALGGNDLYQSAESSRRIPPTSNPLLVDTDADRVTDFSELTGYSVGLAIRDGTPPCGVCNGKSETLAIGDDIQQARLNGPVFHGGIVVLPGPNGTIESTAAGDDHKVLGHTVTTDPLRRDTDSDLVNDGRELDVGGDPTNPLDAAEFKDSDRDGLADSEESILGWMVSANGLPEYLALSNPSRPDSDMDGLPDLAERIMGTDPNKSDTDGDGLTDFDELNDFAQFRGLSDENPGFVVDPAASKQYGSNPLQADTDGDLLNDKLELVTGYHILIAGESQPRWIHTDPTSTDTDLDGALDHYEWVEHVPQTDASDPDSDDDGRSDGAEKVDGTDPLARDIKVTVNFGTIFLDGITDNGVTSAQDPNPAAEVAWFYTIIPPSGPRELISDAWDGNVVSVPPGFPGLVFGTIAQAGIFASCHIIEIGPENYTIPLNKSKSYALKPGEQFKVEGILVELDNVSNDCGKPPFFIPTVAESGCITRFSQSFYFNDFDAGGKASFPFPNGSQTAENCHWEQEIFVSAK